MHQVEDENEIHFHNDCRIEYSILDSKMSVVMNQLIMELKNFLQYDSKIFAAIYSIY